MRFTRKKKLSKLQQLDNVYLNIKNPHSYTSVANLRNSVSSKITDEDLKNYLQANMTYTLHKPVRKKMTHNKVKAVAVDNVWAADLGDFQNISKFNDGVKYILFVIDVFSKYLFVRTLKSKKGEEVANQFADIIIKSERKPALLHSDEGGELWNSHMNKIMTELDILHYATGSQMKSGVAERVIRSIKQRMYKYFTHKNTFHYLDVIDQIVLNYNKTVHSTTKYKPIDVNSKNSDAIYEDVFADEPVTRDKSDLKIGDYVRIALLKGIYRKGYEESYSREVFIIDDITHKNKKVPMYTLKEVDGETIKGSFLKEEVQKVVFDPNATYPIEKIIETKGTGRNKIYLVKWLGWPKVFNSFVSAANIRKYPNKNKDG